MDIIYLGLSPSNLILLLVLILTNPGQGKIWRLGMQW